MATTVQQLRSSTCLHTAGLFFCFDNMHDEILSSRELIDGCRCVPVLCCAACLCVLRQVPVAERIDHAMHVAPWSPTVNCCCAHGSATYEMTSRFSKTTTPLWFQPPLFQLPFQLRRNEHIVMHEQHAQLMKLWIISTTWLDIDAHILCH